MASRVFHLALHWLAIIALIASTLVAPAQAANEALQQAATAQMQAAMAGMPCGDEMAPAADTHKPPCDCCKPASCDLSACLGTAYLHTLPRMPAAVLTTTEHLPVNAKAQPIRLFDTPLRPQIA
mgnify:CR=1 FL=1